MSTNVNLTNQNPSVPGDGGPVPGVGQGEPSDAGDKLTKLVNEVLVVEPTRGVTVNDQMFPCIRGTPTESGFYKNGWTTKQIEGKNGKHTYLQWNVYTSVGSQIDIEMKAMFRLKNTKWNLCLHTGWHGVNLYDGDNDYIINYLQSCRRPVNDNDSDVDSDDSSEQGGGGAGASATTTDPSTPTAEEGDSGSDESEGDSSEEDDGEELSRSQLRAWAASSANKTAAAAVGHLINGNSSSAAIRSAMDAVQEQGD